MKRHGLAYFVPALVVVLLASITGCRSEYVYAGNLAVGAVPWVLMYLVLTLKRVD